MIAAIGDSTGDRPAVALKYPAVALLARIEGLSPVDCPQSIKVHVQDGTDCYQLCPIHNCAAGLDFTTLLIS